jgi:hypothetical protein
MSQVRICSNIAVLLKEETVTIVKMTNRIINHRREDYFIFVSSENS